MDVQNHIHLAETLESSPQYAPIYTWSARDRQLQIMVKAEITEGLQGARFFHVQRLDEEPVLRFDFSYEIKLRTKGMDTTFDLVDRLNGLVGKELYLVDHRHGDDGSDHRPFTHRVGFKQIGTYKTDHIALQFFYVPIYLVNLDDLT